MSKGNKQFDGLSAFGVSEKAEVSNENGGTYDDFEYPIVDNETEEESSEEEEEEASKEEPSKEENNSKDTLEEEEDISSLEDTDNLSVEDLDSIEGDITGYVQEKLYEELGWEFGEEAEKLTSVKDLVNYMKSLVEENSVPQYANDDIKALNEFVANGGRLQDYFSNLIVDVDLEKVNVDKKADQIAVLRALYKEQGLTDDKINRRIDRFDETGILQEEAEDGLESLKKIQEKKTKKRLEEQKSIKESQEKQQQKFVTNVMSTIKSLDEIYPGVNLTVAEKEKLTKDILNIDNDGYSRYQKKYHESPELNLIRSAYLTLYGEKILSKLDKKANTNATKKLKNSLNTIKTKKTKSDTFSRHKSGSGFNPLSAFGS
jgi:hypothetical protein